MEAKYTKILNLQENPPSPRRDNSLKRVCEAQPKKKSLLRVLLTPVLLVSLFSVIHIAGSLEYLYQAISSKELERTNELVLKYSCDTLPITQKYTAAELLQIQKLISHMLEQLLSKIDLVEPSQMVPLNYLNQIQSNSTLLSLSYFQITLSQQVEPMTINPKITQELLSLLNNLESFQLCCIMTATGALSNLETKSHRCVLVGVERQPLNTM